MSTLETLRAKLDLLARRDRWHSVFSSRGPHGHRYKERPPLSPEELRTLEASFGVALPDDVRLFLTQVHSGGPGPGYGLFIEPDSQPLGRRRQEFPFSSAMATQVVQARLSGSDRRASLELPPDDDEDDNDWPPGPGFVPIAHHGCGIFDVVVTVGEQRGRIWWYDMAWCPVYDKQGEIPGFLEWYEHWLDDGLEKVTGRFKRFFGRWTT